MSTPTKKICSCGLCVALVLFCIMGNFYVVEREGKQYEGAAQGFAGEIKVSVFVDGNTITDITYQTEGETPSIGGSAIKSLRTRILKTQNTQIDAISGATYSSRGFLEAVNAALATAGVVADGSGMAAIATEDYEATADVVVVGGGGVAAAEFGEVLGDGLLGDFGEAAGLEVVRLHPAREAHPCGICRFG